MQRSKNQNQNYILTLLQHQALLSSMTPECFTAQCLGYNRFTVQYLFLKLDSTSKRDINYEVYNLLSNWKSQIQKGGWMFSPGTDDKIHAGNGALVTTLLVTDPKVCLYLSLLSENTVHELRNLSQPWKFLLQSFTSNS